MKFRSSIASRLHAAWFGGVLFATASSSFAQDDVLAVGKQLFTQGATPPCAICHTLADAESTGQIGPVLDEIKPDAQRVLKALRNGLGQMPSFKGKLSEEQMQALATYVSTVTGGAR